MPKFNDNPKYLEWIREVIGDCHYEEFSPSNKPDVKMLRVVGYISKTLDGEPLIQRCETAAPMMAAAFPELKAVRGFYTPTWSDREHFHCWCVDAEGAIVDPTGRQFDRLYGIDSYREGTYRVPPLPGKQDLNEN
jgi:hypothetical protein